jgi:plasmid stabilization system protein ParE
VGDVDRLERINQVLEAGSREYGPAFVEALNRQLGRDEPEALSGPRARLEAPIRMRPVRLHPLVYDDIDQALERTRERFGPTQVPVYERLIIEGRLTLRRHPTIGRLHPELGPGVRVFCIAQEGIKSIHPELVGPSEGPDSGGRYSQMLGFFDVNVEVLF